MGKITNEYGEALSETYDTDNIIRDRIIHILTIYPRISVSMLQIGVGTSLMPKVWKPVLDQMIVDGQVIKECRTYKTPNDRQQQYIILQLAESVVSEKTVLLEM